jgi:radical SAM superfamily enzyme YgiQ (UPF0313 family)
MVKRNRMEKGLRNEETGAVRKEWGGKIPIALVFPNLYRVAISNLGFQIIYQILNQNDDVVCERVFLPEAGSAPGPIRSWESRRSLLDFELIAVSLPYENDYLNLFQLLKSASLPFFSRERGDSYPLLLGGGLALTLNPEPLAEVLDLVVVGEGETPLRKIMEIYRSIRGMPRAEILKSLARVEGVYVPSGYFFSPAGREPLPDFPARVRRQFTFPLTESPGHSAILTSRMEFGRSVLIEPIRGCGRRCRFCAAGYHYLPPRSRPLDRISGLSLAQKEKARVGLLGAALADYPEFSLLLEKINQAQVKITLSSLHGEELTDVDLACLARGQARTLTLAPESGSERLRLSVNKTSTDEQYLDAARRMVAFGIPHLRLYFLYGLPGEVPADLRAIGDFVEKIQQQRRKESRKVPGRLTVCLAPFVPKPATPFQWAEMESGRVLKQKREEIIRSLRPVPQVLIRTESVSQARLEAYLGRADRQMGKILEGRTFPEIKRLALGDDVPWLQPSPDPEISFPWDVVDSGVTRDFLWQEWQNSRLGVTTSPCPPRSEPASGEGRAPACSRCGVCAIFSEKNHDM